jgi:nucleotide-binding universal stress UspA family protein
MKSLLLYAQNDSGLEARMQAALDIARATQGHLTCLHVTPTSAYVATEPFGGMFIMQDIMTMLDEQERTVRKLVEAKLAKEDVSWDYEALTTDIHYGLVDRGSLSDLIIMSHPPHRKDAPVIYGIIGDVIVDSRTPVLVVPETTQAFKVGGAAVVAWNDSFEAANALRAAVPLLKLAEKVIIVMIEKGKQKQEPSLAPAEYLSRHGIHAEVHNETADQIPIQEALKLAVDWLNADYVVMGAYGHSRAREYWFGGVTRSMLHEPPVPILFGR